MAYQRHLLRGWWRLWVLILLSIALATCQAGWSAPEPMTPSALASQLHQPEVPVILDVRSPEEFAAGHIPGATNVPYRAIPERLSELAAFKSQDIVIYCEVGVRAGIAEGVLAQAGFERLTLLEGHMQAWRAAELPIDTMGPTPTP